MWRERPSTPTLLSVAVSQEAESERLLISHAGAHENIITIYCLHWGVGGWVSGLGGGGGGGSVHIRDYIAAVKKQEEVSVS